MLKKCPYDAYILLRIQFAANTNYNITMSVRIVLEQMQNLVFWICKLMKIN